VTQGQLILTDLLDPRMTLRWLVSAEGHLVPPLAWMHHCSRVGLINLRTLILIIVCRLLRGVIPFQWGPTSANYGCMTFLGAGWTPTFSVASGVAFLAFLFWPLEEFSGPERDDPAIEVMLFLAGCLFIIIYDIWRHFREASLAVDRQAIETKQIHNHRVS
jgi:hypothetical protein